MPTPRTLILVSVGAAVATIGLKAAAYAVTGSVGLLSDALESGVNLVAAVTAYLTLRYADKPVDAGHTYGHEKISYFSSGLEGVLVVLAGVGTAAYAIGRLVEPTPVTSIWLGTAVALVAAGVNLAVGRMLVRHGREMRSIVLEADGEHLLADVWSTLAVVAGLGVVALTGWSWVDPLLALAVSVLIARTGLRLIRVSFDGLMDHALDDADLALVRQTIRAELPEGTAFHALRSRQAGRDRFADFHLLVPGGMTVEAAHALADRLEDALTAVMPRLHVFVHVEPIESERSWADHPPGLDG